MGLGVRVEGVGVRVGMYVCMYVCRQGRRRASLRRLSQAIRVSQGTIRVLRSWFDTVTTRLCMHVCVCMHVCRHIRYIYTDDK